MADIEMQGRHDGTDRGDVKHSAPISPGHDFWTAYMKRADRDDKGMLESWRDDMDGLLIFAGLFSAVLTAFLVESYKLLQPDSGDQTVAVLLQISQQLAVLANTTQASIPPVATIPRSFSPSHTNVGVNVFWFLSLVLSLTCALGATLVKQWTRVYQHDIRRQSLPEHQGKMRAFLYDGVQHSKVEMVVDGLPTLLHGSLALFFAGLVLFLFQISTPAFASVIIVVGLGLIAYAGVSIAPLKACESPFRTPGSVLLANGLKLFSALKRRVSKNHGLLREVPWTGSTLTDQREDLAYRLVVASGVDHRQLDNVLTRRLRREARVLRSALELVTDADEVQAWVTSFPHIVASLPAWYQPQLISTLLAEFDETDAFMRLVVYKFPVNDALAVMWTVATALSSPEYWASPQLVANASLRRVTSALSHVHACIQGNTPHINLRVLEARSLHLLQAIDILLKWINVNIRYVRRFSKFSLSECLSHATAATAVVRSSAADSVLIGEQAIACRQHFQFIDGHSALPRSARGLRARFQELQNDARIPLDAPFRTASATLLTEYSDCLHEVLPEHARWLLLESHLRSMIRTILPDQSLDTFVRTSLLLVSRDNRIFSSGPDYHAAAYNAVQNLDNAPDYAKEMLSKLLCEALRSSNDGRISVACMRRLLDSDSDAHPGAPLDVPRFLSRSTCSEVLLEHLSAYHDRHPDAQWLAPVVAEARGWLDPAVDDSPPLNSDSNP